MGLQMGDNIEQVVDGILVCPPQEICLVHALKTFAARNRIDTQAQIVQMIVRNIARTHWYYKSAEWIEQPYLIKDLLVAPFTGPVQECHLYMLYGQGTYRPSEAATRLAQSQDSEVIIEELQSGENHFQKLAENLKVLNQTKEDL